MSWLSFFMYFGIVYAILYTASKLIFSIMSLLEIRIYFWRYDHIIEEHELKAHLEKNHHNMPLISIISPAYNEGVLILDTVHSFLNQSYKNKEVIVCSDGGTDGTLEKLIEHFELVETEDNFVHSPHIQHKQIHRFFRSSNPDYKDLIVIDKENGGKADAQNAGVAIARGEIVTIIDADSILEKYALIHLADIFEREGRVIGVGTPIGVVNDCNIGPDGVDDASVPKSFWAKIQVIEYLRSFLLGRMFAQRYRGLQIVSGAFGVYKKWIVEAVGGYTTGSLAEDMDIDGKIWRYIDTQKLRYRIRYIPEAFCWSEVPNTFKSLASQRDRWARGMTETIWKNKDLFFNPRYKMLGLFSYPYYVFFEWLTPFIEITGILYFIIGASLGWFSFTILGYIFLAYWIIGILLNVASLSVEAFTRGHYKNRKTLLRLSFYAVLEPLFYHWINSYLYVVGNLKLIFLRKKGWGKMERVGLHKSAETSEAQERRLQPTILGVRETSVEPDKVHSITDSNGSKKKWKAVAALSAVLTSMIGGWYYLIYAPQQVERKAMIEAETTQQRQEETFQLAHENPPEPKDEEALTDTVAVVLDEVEKVVPPETERTVATIHEPTGLYYIIIASVINTEYARNNAEALRNKGVQVKIIPSYGTSKYNLITVAEAPTIKEAQSKLEALKSEYGDEIWILKY
jgi:poly-beta-1,6-N-acetyl-D-glucosamine synthase